MPGTDAEPGSKVGEPAVDPDDARQKDRLLEEELLDEALEESFPASDPPAVPSLHDLERDRKLDEAIRKSAIRPR